MICLVYQWQVFWSDDVYHVRGYVCGEMVALVEGLEGLGGEVAGEEEECVYPLGSPVSREEFFM